MGLTERPSTLAQRQAVAAVGQIHLMRYYQDFFAALGLVSCCPVIGQTSWYCKAVLEVTLKMSFCATGCRHALKYC